MSLRMAVAFPKQAGQNNPFATLPNLELNPKHPLIRAAEMTSIETAFADLRTSCMTRPCCAEGGELDDPAIFVRRVNRPEPKAWPDKPKIILQS